MNWWPKFSITDLLWLTVAVALGFAISGAPEATPISNQFDGLISDTRWPDGLQATGGLLLLFALVQHGRRVLKAKSTESGLTSGIYWRACVCFFLAAALGVLSMLRLLFTREIINEPKHEEMLQVWNNLWPDVLLTVVTLVSLRVLLVMRRDILAGSRRRRIVNLLTIAAILSFSLWMLTDRTLITMLVHIAINGIEVHHAGWLQRPGVFPHHAMEGYWSFWVSTAAAVVALTGALLVLLDCRWKPRLQRTARLMFWIIVVSLGAFAWWFTYREFPRINPDMASVPSPRLWSDTLAGVILWIGIAVCLAGISARVRDASIETQVEVPVGGLLVVAGALFVCVAEVWGLIESIRVMHSMADIFGGPAGLIDLLETFGQMLCWPETLLPLLVLVSAVALLWQSIRRPGATKPIQPFSPRRFAYFTLAWAAILAVAVPAFWSFSMCYWLGPLVL